MIKHKYNSGINIGQLVQYVSQSMLVSVALLLIISGNTVSSIVPITHNLMRLEDMYIVLQYIYHYVTNLLLKVGEKNV
jgi:hypothetical protein